MAENIKISALNELASGSVVGTTIVPVVDGGVTLKAQMSSIKAFTNSDVATDTELANQISAVNNTINALDTDGVSEGSNLYYTDARVKSKLNADGVLSGSLPATFDLGVIADGTSVSNVDSITFYGASLTDDGSGDVSVSINSGSSLTVDDTATTVSAVDSITFTGATVTAGATGNVGVDISAGISGITVIDDADVPTSVSNTTTINFEGTTITDEGSGEVTININPTETTELNTFTGSIGDRVTALESSEADNNNESLNTFTGSFSSSIESRVTTLETDSGGSSIDGAVSSSQQISDLGFVSSSRKFISDTITISSASIDGDITLEVAAAPPAGGGDGDVQYDNNFHIISKSVADESVINLNLSQIKIGTGINDFKFTDFSESLDSRFGSGGGSDYISDVTFSDNQLTFVGQNNGFNGTVPLSDGIVSSSLQISNFDFITNVEVADNLPQGTISGSTQIVESGFVTTDSTSSFALNDNITGSFTELSASIASDIAGISGVSEATLGEATRSLLEGGSFDAEGNNINLVSSSTQIQEAITDEYISASAAASGFGSTVGGSSDVSSLNAFTGSFSSSIEARIIDIETGGFIEPINTFTGSFSSSVSDRFDSNEGRLDTLEVTSTDLSSLNSFTGSFSASVADRFELVEGAGGGADYVSNVVLTGTNLNFTGQGSAFNNSVDLASLAGGGETEASYGLISQSYDKSQSNLELGNIVIGGTSGDVTLTTVSQSFDTRINAINGVSGLSGLSDVGDITVDVANGDIFLYDSVEQEFTHSKVLNGDYKITGSVDTKGSMDVSGSITVLGTVTADSFVAGDVGTPTINSATDLDMEATNAVNIDGGGINLTAAGSGMILSSSTDITVNHMLTLGKTIGEPSTSPVTGSIMNSGSIDSDSKLWFFNGTEWKEIAFV